MQEDSPPGQECPALTQVGILLRSSTSDGLFSTPHHPHPPWHSVYIPTVARPHSLHAADATKRFHRQIAFSRWFFEPCRHFACALLAIHVHFFPPKKLNKHVRWGLCPWETSDEFLTSIVAWAVSHLSAMNGEHAGRFLSCVASGIRHSDSQSLLESRRLPNQTLTSHSVLTKGCVKVLHPLLQGTKRKFWLLLRLVSALFSVFSDDITLLQDRQIFKFCIKNTVVVIPVRCWCSHGWIVFNIFCLNK